MFSCNHIAQQRYIRDRGGRKKKQIKEREGRIKVQKLFHHENMIVIHKPSINKKIRKTFIYGIGGWLFTLILPFRILIGKRGLQQTVFWPISVADSEFIYLPLKSNKQKL